MNETALKERLKVIAKEKGITFNEVWKQLLLERFLARVSASDYHDHFIFKGGLLLAQRIQIGRETTDIDFLMTQLKSEIPTIEAAFREIAGVDVGDSFRFEFQKIEELTQPHMEYPGFRVSLGASLGKMKDRVQVDVGVGDPVDPIEEHFRPFEYKGKPIFEGEITLLAYPAETIFAEKLETIISKGATNSRMKDYHDVILMTRQEGLLDVPLVRSAIAKTFEYRGTNLEVPIAFDVQGVTSLQKLWSAHLAGLGRFRQVLGLPESFADTLTEINTWISKNQIGAP